MSMQHPRNAPVRSYAMGELIVWHRDGTSSRYALREIDPDYWRFELAAETRRDMAVPLLPTDEIEIVRSKPRTAPKGKQAQG